MEASQDTSNKVDIELDHSGLEASGEMEFEGGLYTPNDETHLDYRNHPIPDLRNVNPGYVDDILNYANAQRKYLQKEQDVNLQAVEEMLEDNVYGFMI